MGCSVADRPGMDFDRERTGDPKAGNRHQTDAHDVRSNPELCSPFPMNPAFGQGPASCESPFRAESLLSELAEAAAERRFAVAPNPCVGAALLDDEGRELARGFHERWGGAHAEVEAIEAARAAGVDPDRWHTLVVTLEPCSSQGKTPPCTDAIVAAGIKRVIVGATDPDPRHRGAGLEALAAAGLEVEFEPSGSPLARVAPYFQEWTAHERLRRPRPWLIAKWAQTLTGQLLPPADVGQGRWISTEASRLEVQRLRRSVDAIFTGIGTVRADDPRLSLRGEAARGAKPPLRIILDTELGTPPDARLLQPVAEGEAAGLTYILCRAGASPARHRALREAGARIHSLRPGPDGRMPLRDVLAWAWRFGVRRAMLEAGPKLIQSCFDAGFVDQMRVYSGSVRGGRGESLAPLLSRLELRQRMDREVDGDAVVHAFPRAL